MTASHSLNLRLGLTLVLTGLFLPLLLFPFSKGRVGEESFSKSLCRAYFPLLEKTRAPTFTAVQQGQKWPDSQAVQLEQTRLFVEFPTPIKILEIQKIMSARFPENKPLPGDPDSGRIRFEGWSGHEALNLRFWHILTGGALLAIIGAALLLFRGGSRNPENP